MTRFRTLMPASALAGALPEATSAFASLAWHQNHVYAVGEDPDGAPVVRRYLVDLP